MGRPPWICPAFSRAPRERRQDDQRSRPAAPHVEELDARWAPEHGEADEPGRESWAREVTFRYAPGQAPRIVTHEPRLADGDYLVEVELVADNDQTSIVRKHVTLSGGVTQIELAPSVTR